MKQNVGELDSVLRIASGLFMLGYGINRDSTWWMALGGLMTAEGITRYCLMLDALGISTNEAKPKAVEKAVRRAMGRVAKVTAEI